MNKKVKEFLNTAEEVRDLCKRDVLKCDTCALNKFNMCSAHTTLVAGIEKSGVLKEEKEEIKDNKEIIMLILDSLEDINQKVDLIKDAYGPDVKVITEECVVGGGNQDTYIKSDIYFFFVGNKLKAILEIEYNFKTFEINVGDIVDVGGRL